MLANIHRNPKKKPEPFEPADFFPSLPRGLRRVQVMSGEEIAKTFVELNRGRDSRENAD